MRFLGGQGDLCGARIWNPLDPRGSSIRVTSRSGLDCWGKNAFAEKATFCNGGGEWFVLAGCWICVFETVPSDDEDRYSPQILYSLRVCPLTVAWWADNRSGVSYCCWTFSLSDGCQARKFACYCRCSVGLKLFTGPDNGDYTLVMCYNK